MSLVQAVNVTNLHTSLTLHAIEYVHNDISVNFDIFLRIQLHSVTGAFSSECICISNVFHGSPSVDNFNTHLFAISVQPISAYKLKL